MMKNFKNKEKEKQSKTSFKQTYFNLVKKNK